ncbi:hypothetical protein B1964_16225 [Gordonia sp. i37]|nr:hypothetical protein B1964_16225 [Gordonia sp. i37]
MVVRTPRTAGRSRWRRPIALALVVVAAALAGYAWLQTRGDGVGWYDVGVGDCVGTHDRPEMSLLHPGGGYGRHTAVHCSTPAATYVVAVRPAVPAIGQAQMTCPDPGKDVSGFARYEMRSVSVHGRFLFHDTSYGYAPICLAPNLHVGSCYDAGEDRGPLVSPQPCDGLVSWLVTRQITGVADIHRCPTATGLVLHSPLITYCEINYPDPDNPLLRFGPPPPRPPAG